MLNSKELQRKLDRMNWQAKNGRISNRQLMKFNMEVAKTNAMHNDVLHDEKEKMASDRYKELIEPSTRELVRKLK